jgi:F-type H+-transporting ATPase subunit beta
MFWVYENWTRKRARVHLGGCVYCKNGKGLHGTAGNGNDTWHGPFASRADAYAKLKATRQKDMQGCAVCGA